MATPVDGLGRRDTIIESTGRLTDATKARGQLEAGARKESLSPLQRRTKTSPLFWGSTRGVTIRYGTTSFRVLRATWHVRDKVKVSEASFLSPLPVPKTEAQAPAVQVSYHGQDTA
jgi:hypothetical protein